MPKKSSSVEVRIRAILSHTLIVDEEEITLGTALQQDLDADSLDLIEVAMELEDEFHIQIDGDAFAKVVTVQDAVKLVERLAA